MAVRRGPRPSDRFAQISNVLLQDFTLSSKARGLAAMMLSFPPGWETTVSKLSKQLKGKGDGYEGVRTGFLELEERGYLIRVQERLANGRMGDLDQWIFDDPRDAEAFRLQLEAEAAEAAEVPRSENPIPGVTSGNATSSQVGAGIGFSDRGGADDGESSTTKTDSTKTHPKKTENKTGERGPASSSPSRTRGATTTPDDRLEAAGLTSARDRGRFREWLRTARNITSPNGLIMSREHDDLVSQVAEWRRSLDVTAEPDAEPILCDHGQDIALGEHMCPLCDPDRQRPASTPADVAPDSDGAKMPEWVREAREALAAGDRSTFFALVGPDETAGQDGAA